MTDGCFLADYFAKPAIIETETSKGPAAIQPGFQFCHDKSFTI